MTDDRPRVVVVGNRNLARHVLVYLLENDWNVVGAVGAAGDAARRQAGFVPFDEIAQSHGIELVETGNLNDEESRRSLASLEPDICICPGWHQIIEPSVLDIPSEGFLGFHSSDLPRGRGGAPINWSVIHGEDEITICLFQYTSGVDAGAIVAKERVPVKERDDVSTVIDRLAVAACDALSTVRQKFESGTIDATPQSEAEATYRPRRQPQDGIIDWNATARELRDWVRAQTSPYPGAYTFFEGGTLIVWSASIPNQHENRGEYEPGTVIATVAGEGIDVAVSDGIVRLTRVQPADRPRMWADEFARRYSIEKGDRLGASHTPRSWLYTGIRDEHGGTDFSDATNLSIGESGRIQAVIRTGQEREITVRVRLDEQELLSQTVHVEDDELIPIEYDLEKSGTYSLVVEFYRDDERIDVRYLKVFIY